MYGKPFYRRKNGRERDRLRFVEASVPSPYIEVSMTDLNIREPEGTRWRSIRSIVSLTYSDNCLTATRTRWHRRGRFYSMYVCIISHRLICGRGFQRRIIITVCWRRRSVWGGMAVEQEGGLHCLKTGAAADSARVSAPAAKDGELSGGI